MTSLILGAYSRLPVSLLSPFVRSLRATAFNGSLCIVAGQCDDEQRVQIGDLADAVVDVRGDYSNDFRVRRAMLNYLKRQRGLRRTYDPAFRIAARFGAERDSERRWACLEYHLEGLQALRYMYYHRYIVERAPQADRIMLTDLRDVVFQRDPFEDPLVGLEVYLEDESVRIGADAFNTRWIRELFGESLVREMTGRVVSCSGTVIGTREAMLAYCAEMMRSIVWRRRPMGEHDQAVHNALLYEGRLPAATAIPNGTGRVLTLGGMAAPGIDHDGLIRNSDGSVPAVLHQWDRHAALAERFSAL